MLTKKPKKRIILLSTFFLLSILSVGFILISLDKVYFTLNTRAHKFEKIISGKTIRIGGLVKKNSINIKDDE